MNYILHYKSKFRILSIKLTSKVVIIFLPSELSAKVSYIAYKGIQIHIITKKGFNKFANNI
jgi:hypothetical protein